LKTLSRSSSQLAVPLLLKKVFHLLARWNLLGALKLKLQGQ
jgi:hypothetical protein